MPQQNDGKTGEKIVIHIDADLEDLIPGFIENRKKDTRSIGEALQKGDYETIRIVGHGMKGAGGGYGFDAISDIGKFIEQAAKSKNSEEIQNRVNDLLTYLDRIEIVYDSD